MLDNNWLVTRNTLGPRLITHGLLIENTRNFVVSDNSITGIRPLPLQAGRLIGVEIAFSVGGGIIAGNRISDIKQFMPGSGIGIYIAATSSASNLTIANNFISDVAGAGFNNQTPEFNAAGIAVVSGGGYKILHNSILLNTNQLSQGDTAQTAAINITNGVVAAGAVELRNNIFANTQTLGTRYGIICNAPAGIFAAISNNDYFAQNVGFGGGSARPTLSDWQIFTGQDANSLAVDPLFVSAVAPADLHLQAGSLLINAGIPVGISTDIDGETRDSQPDIGADEVSPLNECGVCHKGTQTLILPCSSLGYRRHLDHGDAIGPCP